MKTSIPRDVAEARGWGADFPAYWLVILDGHDHVLEAQRLATAFKRGHEPDSDNLWSSFELTVPSELTVLPTPLGPSGPDPLVTLRLWEPSPSGTAWGRNGVVRFRWPGFEPLEWEYEVFHFVNPALNSTERWSWVDRSGSSQHAELQFQFALPQVTLDHSFVAEAWISAEFERCASRLSSKNAKQLPGYRSSPHSLLAVLSSEAELFLGLEIADGAPISKAATLQICFASGVLRSEPHAPITAPSCDSFSLVEPKPASVRVDKAPHSFRYKVSFPNADLTELPAITVVLRDPMKRQSLMSSPLDFKTDTTLGDVLQFSPERVTCQLEGERLTPRFAPSNPAMDLLDQIR